MNPRIFSDQFAAAKRGKLYRLKPIPGKHRVATIFGEQRPDFHLTAKDWFDTNKSSLNCNYLPHFPVRCSTDSRHVLFVVDSHLSLPSLTFYSLEGSDKAWCAIKCLVGETFQFYGVDLGEFELVELREEDL